MVEACPRILLCYENAPLEKVAAVLNTGREFCYVAAFVKGDVFGAHPVGCFFGLLGFAIRDLRLPDLSFNSSARF